MGIGMRMIDRRIVHAMRIIGAIIDDGVLETDADEAIDELQKLNDAWNILNRLVGKWPQ